MLNFYNLYKLHLHTLCTTLFHIYFMNISIYFSLYTNLYNFILTQKNTAGLHIFYIPEMNIFIIYITYFLLIIIFEIINYVSTF